MTEKLEPHEDRSEAPKLILVDDETAFQKEFGKIASDVEQIAEKAIREKNIDEAEEVIGTYEERLKEGTLPEGVRDERDFEEYAEEKRARARESGLEPLTEARKKVEAAYENKEDERTSLEKDYPLITNQILAVVRKNHEIDTPDIISSLEKVWRREGKVRDRLGIPGFNNLPLYDILASHLDDLSKLGVELDAQVLLNHFAWGGYGDYIADCADQLARHGATLDPNTEEDLWFSYGTRLKNYDALAKLGYDKSFEECFESSDFCFDSDKGRIKKESEQEIVDNLDSILEHGIPIGRVVKKLSPETVARNYDTLKEHGAVIVNPVKHFAILRNRKKSA